MKQGTLDGIVTVVSDYQKNGLETEKVETRKDTNASFDHELVTVLEASSKTLEAEISPERNIRSKTLEAIPEENLSPNNKKGGEPPPQKGKKQNRMAHKDIFKISAEASINTIKEHYESLAEQLEDIAYIEDESEYNQKMASFEKLVEQMIYQQLLSKKEVPRTKKEMEYESEYSLIDQKI